MQGASFSINLIIFSQSFAYSWIPQAGGTNRGDGSLQYTIFEASVDSMSIQVSERLTEEACRAIVFASGSQHVLLGRARYIWLILGLSPFFCEALYYSNSTFLKQQFACS